VAELEQLLKVLKRQHAILEKRADKETERRKQGTSELGERNRELKDERHVSKRQAKQIENNANQQQRRDEQVIKLTSAVGDLRSELVEARKTSGAVDRELHSVRTDLGAQGRLLKTLRTEIKATKLKLGEARRQTREAQRDARQQAKDLVKLRRANGLVINGVIKPAKSVKKKTSGKKAGKRSASRSKRTPLKSVGKASAKGK
jgi:chromosome segregation ATPase